MNESVATVTGGINRDNVGVQRNAVALPRVRSIFHVGMSATMLVIVLLGFGPTLYLRPVFDPPGIPVYLVVHGVVLTAWFVAYCIQTTMVAVRRTDIHRKLGIFAVGLGAAVFAFGLMVTLEFAPRQSALGVDLSQDGARLSVLSWIIWANFAALLSFAGFLSAAVAHRRRPELHKRLMLLASISIMQPAIARIGRWPVFDSVENTLFPYGGLVLLVLALALHDVVSHKRIHLVTLLGGSWLIGSRVFSVFVISTSEFGRSFIRGLAQ